MKYLISFLVCVFITHQMNAQSLSLFDVDASNFPVMKAKFFAFDAEGKQQRPSASELTLTENGMPRTITSVTCPPGLPPLLLSSVLVIDISGSMSSGYGSVSNIELAKTAARTWVNGLSSGISECALTSFDGSNYLNQDFTTDRNKLLDAIAPLAAQGGTDYNAALINPMAGGLQISKNGKYQQVIVLLTDGLGDGNENDIIAQANLQNCIIFCVTLGMPAPSVLKNIASKTRGQVFENITTEQQIEEVYRKILQVAQGGSPCDIIWQSNVPCETGNTTVEVGWQGQSAQSAYSLPQNSIASLQVIPPYSAFGENEPGLSIDKNITITAINTDFRVLSINRNFGSPDFTVVNTTFPLDVPKNSSKILTLRFIPNDSSIKYASFEIVTDKCAANFSSGGGYVKKKMTAPTLKLTKPNGGEEFVAGSDTLITWDGIAKSETVQLEYTADNGTTWKTITSSATNLQHLWKNIPKPASNQCKIRIKQSSISNSSSDPGTVQFDLSGHTSSVNVVSWSPDGSKIASASNDNTAIIWSAASGAKLFTLSGHKSYVNDIKWSPDGLKLATSSYDNTAIIWSATNGTILNTLIGHTASVSDISWSPDGSKLATSSNDSVIIWSATDGTNLFTLPENSSRSYNVGWSPDGTKIVTASYNDNNSVVIWSAIDGKKQLVLKGHKHWINDVSWSPDGTKIASGSIDTTAIIWSAIDGSKLFTLRGHKWEVITVSWSPDGTKIATGSKDMSAIIWSATDGSKLFRLGGTPDIYYFTKIRWSPDGTKIATIHEYKKFAIVWSVTDGTQIAIVNGHTNYVNDVRWSPDGTKIATASDDKSVMIWSSTGWAKLLALTGHFDDVRSASWSPDGTKVATASFDETAIIWSATNGANLVTLRGHLHPKGYSAAVFEVNWNPDGSKVITASSDGTAIIWNAITGKKILTLNGHSASVLKARWSPDGNRVATASDDSTVIIWNAINGTQLFSLKAHTSYVTTVCWSPDGSKVFSGSHDGGAIIWDAANGTKLFTLTGHTGEITDANWSPDGTRIATASRDRTAIIWFAPMGTNLFTLTGHTGWINSVNWSFDGTKVVTASDDQTAIIWSGSDGSNLTTLSGHTDDVITACWSPDGSRVATASADYTAIVWSERDGAQLYVLKDHKYALWDTKWSPDGTKLVTTCEDKTAKIWSINSTPVQEDTSDSVFSIVMPSPSSMDIDMKQCLTGKVKDSVVNAMIRNTGSYPFRVDSIGIIGANTPQFTLVSGIPPFTVRANNNHSVEFRFRPNTIGIKTAQLLVFTQTDTLRQTISGEGIAPLLSITNQFIDFGKVEVGAQKDTLVFTVKNTGTAPLTIDNIRNNGPNKMDFTILVNTGSIVLQPDSSAQLLLRFSPKDIGRTSGGLLFDYNDIGSPAMVQLFGEGISNTGDTTQTIISIQDITAQAGEKVNLVLTIQNKPGLHLTGAPTEWYARIHYNKTVLFNEQTNNSCLSGTDDSCVIELKGTYDPKSSELVSIPCIATLGNTDNSPLVIDEFRWTNGSIVPETETRNGTITINGICEQGGVRLFIPAKSSNSLTTRPNPAQNSIQIQYGLREPLTVTLELLDITGQVVQTIVSNQQQAAGQYTLTNDMSLLGNGVYSLRLTTNKEVLTSRVDVVK